MKLSHVAALLVAVLLGLPVNAQFVVDPLRTIVPEPDPSELLERPGEFLNPGGNVRSFYLSMDGWTTNPRLTGVGSSLAQGPDLDGDCLPELLVAATGWRRSLEIGLRDEWSHIQWFVLQRGLVWAVDPRSGLVLRAWQGRTAVDRFGTRMCALDDLDGDGMGEVAITSPGAHEDLGCVEIFRGHDGLRIREYLGQQRGAGFGETMALLPDLDHDGIRDLAIGAPRARGVEDRAGSVTLLSTASGAVLASIPGPQPDCAFGAALDAEQDLTGDGVRDLVIGAPSYSPREEKPRAGLVLIVSLPDTSVAGMRVGTWSSQRLGIAVGTLPTFDGESRCHVVAASAASAKEDASRGMLQFYAAPDFPMTKQRRGPPAWLCDSQFAASLAVLDDLDGDGGCEVAVGAPQYEQPDDENGAVFVFFSPRGQFRDHWHQSWWKGNDFGLNYFGTSIVRLSDLDNDGVDDYAIGAASQFFHPGGVMIVSGKRRSSLREILGDRLPVP